MQRREVDRRGFLKLSGTGLAGVALLATVGAGDVLAREETDPSLVAEIEEAAERFELPAEVLLGMAWVNTRYEHPPPETGEYEEGDLHGRGSYGIMQLVQNPSSNTLGEASKLTGIPEEDLKTDRRSNVLGGAALLAASQGEKKPARLGDWLGAMDGRGGNGKEYRAVAGVGAGELYAEQVRAALKEGASERTKNGERVTLRAQDLAARVTNRGEVTR